jgi:hypothetical protein
MKFTYIFNSESENILLTEYPKLFLKNNTYSNYDIPHILKDITNVDKLDISILEQKEKEIFNKKILDTILKKWLHLENTIFFELEKLFYVFFCLYSSSKKYFLASYVKNIIKFFYNPNVNIYSIYKNRKTMKEYRSLYNIDSEKGCLLKNLLILESIDLFLAEMRENIKLLKNKSEKFEKILNERIFSFDITIYTLYHVFRDFFQDKEDYIFIKNCLRDCFTGKYEKYKKENEKFNMKDIDNEENDYLGLDYLKSKNKNLSDDVIKNFY